MLTLEPTTNDPLTRREICALLETEGLSEAASKRILDSFDHWRTRTWVDAQDIERLAPRVAQINLWLTLRGWVNTETRTKTRGTLVKWEPADENYRFGDHWTEVLDDTQPFNKFGYLKQMAETINRIANAFDRYQKPCRPQDLLEEIVELDLFLDEPKNLEQVFEIATRVARGCVVHFQEKSVLVWHRDAELRIWRAEGQWNWSVKTYLITTGSVADWPFVLGRLRNMAAHAQEDQVETASSKGP